MESGALAGGLAGAAGALVSFVPPLASSMTADARGLIILSASIILFFSAFCATIGLLGGLIMSVVWRFIPPWANRVVVSMLVGAGLALLLSGFPYLEPRVTIAPTGALAGLLAGFRVCRAN